MAGITEDWLLRLSLLGKFPAEALMFPSPVMRRSESREGGKIQCLHFCPNYHYSFLKEIKTETKSQKVPSQEGWGERTPGPPQPRVQKGKRKDNFIFPITKPSYQPRGMKDLAKPALIKANTSTS